MMKTNNPYNKKNINHREYNPNNRNKYFCPNMACNNVLRSNKIRIYKSRLLKNKRYDKNNS